MSVGELIDLLSKEPKSYEVFIQSARDYLCYKAGKVMNDGSKLKSVTITSVEDEDWEDYDDGSYNT